MKLRNFILGAVAAVVAFAACEKKEENLGVPTISLNPKTLTFEQAADEQTVQLKATRDWVVEDVPEWLSVSPESGDASAEAQTVSISVLENKDMDRNAELKFTIGMKTAVLKVTQTGPGGSADALIVYANDMDNGKVEKVNDKWPYPDQSDSWRNEKGSGIKNVSYSSNGVSVRSVSSTNNLWFPAKGGSYFTIHDIALNSAKSLELSFATVHGSPNGYKKTFDVSKFKVFLSKDNEKWVELPYELTVNADNEFDTASSAFTLDGVDNLSVAFQFLGAEDGYRLTKINLSLYSGSDAGAVDFSNATDVDFGSSSGGDTPAAGQPETLKKVTIKEFLDAPVSTTEWYELTGEIISIVKTDYGNFTIKDATGEVYIYGMTSKWVGKNDKSFSQLGLKVGDTVTLGTLRDEYQGTPQGGGNSVPAYYISHEAGEGEVVPPTGELTLITISDVLAGESLTGTAIEGVVISNKDLNNLTSKKGMYIQDEYAGLQLRLNEDHSFNFGDYVKIDLTGATLGEYGGAVQLSGIALNKVTVISSDYNVAPKTVSVADFLANKYEGQYVAIEGVQVASSDLNKTFVMDDSHTNINLETTDGKNFVAFSSKYATYGTTTVPQGSGTIKGISSINKGTMQVIFTQTSDFAGLTGERFIPESSETPGEGGGEDPDQGGDTPGGEVPPTGEVTGTTLTVSRETIDVSNWTTNKYGSQDIANLDTYLSWSINNCNFIGARLCLTDTSKSYASTTIQGQGNATTTTNQCRLGNTTSLGKIKKITVVTYNEKYAPNFNLALGATQVVGVAVPSNMIAAETMEETMEATSAGNKYTSVYTPTTDAGFFAIYKNTSGALYIESITVEYELN